MDHIPSFQFARRNRQVYKDNMEQKKSSKDDLAAVFNSLSGADKAKLKAAALAGTLTDFIREDTKKHPWKFPLYAAYLLLLVEPIPTGGLVSSFTIASAYAASRLPNAWSRRLKERLDASFDEKAVAEKLNEFIVPDSKKPDAWRVANFRLAKSTLKQSLLHSRESAESALGGLLAFAVNDVAPTLKTMSDASVRTTKTAFDKAQDFAVREVLPTLQTAGSRAASTAKSLWSKVGNLRF